MQNNFFNKKKILTKSVGLKPSLKSSGGFTLIELVVVIALLGIAIGVTNDILVSLIRSHNKTQVATEIEQQANFVSLKMEKELRNARSITKPVYDPSLDFSTGDTLKFETRDGTTISYTVDSSGLITRSLNDSATSTKLTSNASPSGVYVECGARGCFSIAGYNPQVVTINLVFSQVIQNGPSVSYTGSINIDNTIIIRSTY